MTDAEWTRGEIARPTKVPVGIKLDDDVLAWFKARGRGYQTRINAVLRTFVEAQKPRGWPPASGVSSEPLVRLNQRAKHRRPERQWSTRGSPRWPKRWPASRTTRPRWSPEF